MQARGVLARVLTDRVAFTQMGDAVAFEARTRFSRLFAGITTALLKGLDILEREMKSDSRA